MLRKGEIVYEQYGRTLTPEKRWSSFSVAKSITSTLVGSAIKDGYIGSMDDLITQYIPELKESAYDAVTNRHLLTMTSGVKWAEDYGNPNADVAQFITHIPENRVDFTVSYLQGVDQSAPPGDQFNYNTGEINLAGILVARATGKNLQLTCLRKFGCHMVWKAMPFGFSTPAVKKFPDVAYQHVCATMVVLVNLSWTVPKLTAFLSYRMVGSILQHHHRKTSTVRLVMVSFGGLLRMVAMTPEVFLGKE